MGAFAGLRRPGGLVLGWGVLVHHVYLGSVGPAASTVEPQGIKEIYFRLLDASLDVLRDFERK